MRDEGGRRAQGQSGLGLDGRGRGRQGRVGGQEEALWCATLALDECPGVDMGRFRQREPRVGCSRTIELVK